MKRLVVRVVALGVLGLLVTIPAWGFHTSAVDAEEVTSITSYDASFVVGRDGGLDAVETLTVGFPIAAARHGIFRFFDTHDPSAPHARRIPRDIEVTQDGQPATVDLSWQHDHRERVLRIGDPNAFVSSGEHVYRISYRINGVLEKGTSGARSQFYWNLIPGGWAQTITGSRLHVSLPVAAHDVQCAVGTGATSGCTVRGAGTTSLVIRTGGLAANTPVTLRAGLDLPTPPAGDVRPWPGRWDGVLGTSAAVPALAALLALIGAGVGGLLSRRAHEASPAFPLQYAPPEGIGPAQGNYLRTERVDRKAYVASVLEAAEKGAVKLGRNDDSWTITDTGKGWQETDVVTQGVYGLVGSPKGSFTASRKSVAGGKRLKAQIDQFDDEVKAWALSSGNLAKMGLGGFGGFLVLSALAAALALVFWHPLGSIWALVPGAFGIFGLGLLGVGASTIRTPAGRELWSRVGGFHRVLSTPSSEARFDFSGRKELYTAYLPWAVAFGCADAWAKKFRTEVGAEPPVPAYFAGMYAGDHTGNFVDSMVTSFDDTVGSAISSYEASQSSSSSGGGGGGFSGGGGGGGGGGGSW